MGDKLTGVAFGSSDTLCVGSEGGAHEAKPQAHRSEILSATHYTPGEAGRGSKGLRVRYHSSRLTAVHTPTCYSLPAVQGPAEVSRKAGEGSCNSRGLQTNSVSWRLYRSK